ncbi:MAG: tetratricopeptide repeat protein [Myxococcales bacterium]|nr:tetratricopeptide repeat protein [Myxococcales bacterium]
MVKRLPEALWQALPQLAALAFVAHLALAPIAETDLFFHLKIGDLILDRGAIPFRNLFSFTFPDHPDPDLAWGFQVAVALLHRLGGFPAIVLAKTLLVTTAAGLVLRACVRSGCGVLASSLALVVVALAAEPRMVERPHLVTLLGLGALLLLLAEVERGRRGLIWLAVPLTWLWANFHAGVFLGPLVLALYAAGALLDRPRRERPLVAGDTAIVLALAAASTLLTPAGARLPAYLLWHATLGATRSIDEFRAADPWNDPWFFLLATACLAALILGGRRTPWRRALPVLVIGILAWRSVRFVAEWAWIAMPWVADAGSRLAARLPARIALHRFATVAAAIALLGVIALQRRAGPTDPAPGLGLAEALVPALAIDFVTRTGLRDRMYADLDVGCYLLWEGWPRYRVFQDARLPAYPDDFHRALDETALAPAAWDALLLRHGVDAALLHHAGTNMRAGSFDPEEWALVLRDPETLVFARRTPAHERVIAEHEIPLQLRFTFLAGSSSEPITAPPPRSPVPPCAWHARLAAILDGEGDSERALDARARALAGGCLRPGEASEVHYRLGARLQIAGHLREAIVHYDRALALRPDHSRALANRGFARLPTDATGARADLTRALALDPTRADVRARLAGP